MYPVSLLDPKEKWCVFPFCLLSLLQMKFRLKYPFQHKQSFADWTRQEELLSKNIVSFQEKNIRIIVKDIFPYYLVSSCQISIIFWKTLTFITTWKIFFMPYSKIIISFFQPIASELLESVSVFFSLGIVLFIVFSTSRTRCRVVKKSYSPESLKSCFPESTMISMQLESSTNVTDSFIFSSRFQGLP